MLFSIDYLRALNACCSGPVQFGMGPFSIDLFNAQDVRLDLDPYMPKGQF